MTEGMQNNSSRRLSFNYSTLPPCLSMSPTKVYFVHLSHPFKANNYTLHKLGATSDKEGRAGGGKRRRPRRWYGWSFGQVLNSRLSHSIPGVIAAQLNPNTIFYRIYILIILWWLNCNTEDCLSECLVAAIHQLLSRRTRRRWMVVSCQGVLNISLKKSCKTIRDRCVPPTKIVTVVVIRTDMWHFNLNSLIMISTRRIQRLKCCHLNFH